MATQTASGLHVKTETVKNWIRDFDPGHRWLKLEETAPNSGHVERIFCELCRQHSDKLKALRNFSTAYIVGVTGRALKKDAWLNQAYEIGHAY